MKRAGGHGGRTMVFDMEDEETKTKEMEDLCSKLASLIPQDYLPMDTTSQGSSDDLPNQLTHAASYIKDLTEREITVKSDEASHFDVDLTMSSENRVELYMLIHAIEEDGRIEIVQASSCLLEDGNLVHMIKCRARSSAVNIDASMVESRIKRLLITPHAKP
uniref:BHLH domain-containing protein n=1 Tax=Oryza brachyantha TaxID=4533 RepID=J3ME96_ORYBR